MKSTASLLVLLLVTAFAVPASAHCEIPCGIYGDRMRISMTEEDIRTIEKSMKQIKKLSKAKDKNYNQLVRWIVNKDDHANKIQDTAYRYFMAQRVAPAASGSKEHQAYVTQIGLLHKMIVYAMKAKQTTDLTYVAKLRETLAAFEKSYFAKK